MIRLQFNQNPPTSSTTTPTPVDLHEGYMNNGVMRPKTSDIITSSSMVNAKP